MISTIHKFGILHSNVKIENIHFKGNYILLIILIEYSFSTVDTYFILYGSSHTLMIEVTLPINKLLL
jgi:tRNA A-37 threonylcarbamoyl transferase component Bud32